MTTIERLLTITILLQIADLWIVMTRLWIHHVHGWVYKETGKRMSSTYTWTLTGILCSYMIYLALFNVIHIFS